MRPVIVNRFPPLFLLFGMFRRLSDFSGLIRFFEIKAHGDVSPLASG